MKMNPKSPLRRTEPKHANMKQRQLDISTKGRRDFKEKARPGFSPQHSFYRIPFKIFFFEVSLNLTGNLENGLGESIDVGGGDTSHGDTAVLGGVDGVLEKLLGTRLEKVCECKTYLLGEGVHLLGLEASVGEHADLDILSVI